VKSFLGQDYQTRQVTLEGAEGVPGEVDVLLVLEPKQLSQEAVYNLDQYLMRGGRVVICASRYDVAFSADGLNLTPLETGLEEWLDHFGVAITPTLVLDDRNQPLPMPRVRQTPFGALRTWELEPYPYLVQVRDDGMLNRDVTARLDAVGIYWGSPLVVDKSKAQGIEAIPLLQSSPRSWTDDDISRVGFIEYEVPDTGTEPHLLAAAFSGRFKSYFADRQPPAAAAGGRALPLKESPETRLVVVGNAEFLSDFVARALSQVDGGFFVENLRFAQNLIDWVSLDNDMLDIRSRGLVSRRLRRLDAGQEMMIEWLNYAAPLVMLVALGSWFRWRRRQTPPLTATEGEILSAGA
jgi:ABC-2 type transport system permease protein